MSYYRPFSFIGGLVLGGFVGAAIAVLTAPAAGAETRTRIRAEGVALKQRGQTLRYDTIGQAQKLVNPQQAGA